MNFSYRGGLDHRPKIFDFIALIYLVSVIFVLIITSIISYSNIDNFIINFCLNSWPINHLYLYQFFMGDKSNLLLRRIIISFACVSMISYIYTVFRVVLEYIYVNGYRGRKYIVVMIKFLLLQAILFLISILTFMVPYRKLSFDQNMNLNIVLDSGLIMMLFFGISELLSNSFSYFRFSGAPDKRLD